MEDNRGDYTCLCLSGFTGKYCENEISTHPLCEHSPCINNGTCIVSSGASRVECECVMGFTGTRCEIDPDDCESQPCQNGGHCVDESGGFRCDCNDTGYSGKTCQNDVNECLNPIVCLNGGVCYDTYGSYICECPSNYNGFNCERPVDDISERSLQCAKECLPDQECVDGQCCEIYPDSNPPVCKTSIAMALDDCECLNGGTCTTNSSVCICATGYEGYKCEHDIDECALQKSPCINGLCVNEPGSFKCYCTPGNQYIEIETLYENSPLTNID